ncbi:MAG TPA: hypothetical protein VEU62_08350 [Bryobacterales bacterium]|nr:hypothetical protein [Bryobacterales bacterium]
MRRILLAAVLSAAATLLVEHGLAAAAQLTHVVKLEKPRVTVTEVTDPPGVPREPYIRPTDQVIVFLDDCTYDRVNPQTGARQPVKRKSGDVIWHDKGDHAPQLINTGSKPYRTMVIALK